MGFTNGSDSNLSVLSNNTKVVALETSLQQSITNFKDLVLDLEQLHIDSENYKVQYLSMKDRCESKTCIGAEELKKVIATKDQIIQSVASTLTKLNETKNFNILAEAFKILFKEAGPLTPPTELNKTPSKSTKNTNQLSPVSKNIIVKKEADKSMIEDVSFKEDSLCEIEGTPTGRTSPIIPTKKIRSMMPKSTDFRDKKKCPSDWSTPESKNIKLTYPTPSRSKGKLRQARLTLVKMKQTAVVDLTCSPELLALRNEQRVQPLIKKESLENDDTILPSPTSGPTNFTLFHTTSKGSPSKFKKPHSKLIIKSEDSTEQNENKDTSKDSKGTAMQDTVNILNQFADRLRNVMKKDTPVATEAPLDDVTHCETDTPLIQLIDQIEQEHVNKQCSPAKRPLCENINIANTPPKHDAESSMSILRPEPNVRTTAVENVKRKVLDVRPPVYKEETVRKKAEKRALQGWSCDQCAHFFGELYKDDPVMLARKINECSKHRGKHNPARPKTPPNFWNPRWHVPEDTEELNRMNNAT